MQYQWTPDCLPMIQPSNDTIVAPATAPGVAAVAIVRLSGPRAWAMACRIFPALQEESKPRMALVGRLVTPEGTTDDALVLPFRGPRSYTGDDLIEFHLHGSDVIVSGVIRALAALGARPADPGEFTRRAFLAGKMDLIQAEAVAELIEAKSERASHGAAARLAGSLSTKYAIIREELLEVLVHLEATIDFPDEDIETLGYPRLLADIEMLVAQLETMAGTFQQGNIDRDGLRVAIAGRPNAGKSSLLNSLLGVERAIVTPIPGTTRDYLEASLSVAGSTLQLYDTAGLRETEDLVEAEGIRKAKEKLIEADLLLYVIDGSLPPDEAELAGAKELSNGSVVWILNKADVLTPGRVLPDGPGFVVSAKTSLGLRELLQFLGEKAGGQDSDMGARIVSARQQRLVQRALQSLRSLDQGLRAGVAPELAVEDLRDALDAAGELTGEIVNDEVLGEIFSKFCIGK